MAIMQLTDMIFETSFEIDTVMQFLGYDWRTFQRRK